MGKLQLDTFYNEMLGQGGGIRPLYQPLAEWLDKASGAMLLKRKVGAEQLFRKAGIAFAVYGDQQGAERLIPFDIVPRMIAADEWEFLEQGLKQRITALNMFIKDVYSKAEVIKAGIVPPDLVYQNAAFQPEMTRIKVVEDIYVQIAGIDIIRTGEKEFYVLEDNARTPSGVSYMLENREIMQRLFPELFAKNAIRPVETYPHLLLEKLRSVAPAGVSGEPNIVILTPGQYNSAYFEHTFLADKMGVELVEGSDLFVKDNKVYLRSTEGPKQVDVIYRRLDDEYLDPLVFRPDSMLGVPGLMAAYRAGHVSLVNAVGTGIADDKALYKYVPELIRFYLGQEPILKNVPTWCCREKDALAYVLSNLPDLVVKEVNGSGGYGMLVGPHASKAEIENFRKKLEADPFNYIAQPTLSLSTVPCYVESGLAPRHVDLRPFVLTGKNGISIVPGGLTRVALKEGSLVVNSSQGGGTKDTWVVQ